jgi:putative glycosyltransferase (TIGR04372 family)
MKIKIFISKQIVDIKTYGARELFRKFYLLIKILASIPIIIIAIVPCLIIRLLSLWIIIRIDEFPCGNFGALAEIPAIYLCKKKLKIDLPNKKYLDFVYISHKQKVYNRQLVKMWRKKFNFLSGHLLDPINRVNRLIPGWKTHAIGLMSFSIEHDVDNLIEKYQPLDFTNEEEMNGKKILNKFGLKNEDKFVCLAVRDSAYQKKKISTRDRDWSYHDHRNHDIDNFVLAAEELAKRGYYVFRMGVVVNKPLNSNNPKIIDYANSNLRSDFMDVYLGAKCSFCISTGFGFDCVPYIFGKPIVRLIVPIGDLVVDSKKNLQITNHLIFKKEKRKLSLSEIFSHGLAFAFHNKIYDRKEIEIVPHTPEEIKDVVIEMVENLEFKKKISPEDEKLQEIFKSLYNSNIKRFITHPATTKILEEGTKISSEFRAAKDNFKNYKPNPREFRAKISCRFGTKFLKENRTWLQ